MSEDKIQSKKIEIIQRMLQTPFGKAGNMVLTMAFVAWLLTVIFVYHPQNGANLLQAFYAIASGMVKALDRWANLFTLSVGLYSLAFVLATVKQAKA
jgi:hypothetical protein